MRCKHTIPRCSRSCEPAIGESRLCIARIHQCAFLIDFRIWPARRYCDGSHNAISAMPLEYGGLSTSI